MFAALKTIRAQWNGTDSILVATNIGAGLVYLGNCWWDSLWICYAAAAVPIAMQTAWWLRAKDDLLRDALVIGLGLGIAWPIGEGITVNLFGWWGDYTAGGPYLWHTAAYCVLIGWLATAHIVYLSARTLAMGFSGTAAAGVAAVSAFITGLAGENFFVAAEMWSYREARWQFWYIPAFLPIAYAIGYAILPAVQNRPVPVRLSALLACLLVACTGLGVASGFFPE